LSDAFTISSVLAVGGPSLDFALQGVVPNPGRNPSVSLTLPNAEPATLAVYDIAGRQVSHRSVGELGSGRHTVALATTNLAPGVYRVQLTRGGHRLVTRAVVIR